MNNLDLRADRSRIPQRIDEDDHWWFASRTRALETILAKHSRRRDMMILDIGSGAGNMYHHLSRYGDVIGIENHPAPVKVGQARGYDIRLGDATALDLPDASFDLVTALDVIEHNDDDLAILREANRVLRPGGLVLISVPAFQWLWSFNDDLNDHKRRYTAGDLEAKLRTTGFTPLQSSYNNFLVFPLAAGMIALNKRKEAPDALKSHYFDDDAYQVDMQPTHPLVNRLLTGVGIAEQQLLKVASLPIGTGLITIARKNGG
ncbi:MAG: class I SAM-dependent methyltransferase [Anaerolineales bacterium]|nr:class I SAM-dependent methyltransferase [Anaerolineales bacterium]MCB9127035.1 class I SAM-dependent methyltransferase [Ardenticatenales bacterium]